MTLPKKISKAVDVLVDITINSKLGKPVSLPEIAKRQHMSRQYLESLIRVIRNAGYVKAIHGRTGGYLLLVDPKEILVKDIVNLLEGLRKTRFKVEEFAQEIYASIEDHASINKGKQWIGEFISKSVPSFEDVSEAPSKLSQFIQYLSPQDGPKKRPALEIQTVIKSSGSSVNLPTMALGPNSIFSYGAYLTK